MAPFDLFVFVAEPQNDDPKITFNKDTYEIGEVLEANCTTAPAKPPPHITWLINDQKVSNTFAILIWKRFKVLNDHFY